MALNIGDSEIQEPVIDKVSTAPKDSTEINDKNRTANPITVVKDRITDSMDIAVDSLVDCTLFPSVNTIASLMSWSNHYHNLIIEEGATQSACNKAVVYRAEAHCSDQNKLAIRQGLNETLTLCNTINYDWIVILP